MTAPDRTATEEWFVRHGLPWFVDDIRLRVRRRLDRGLLLRWGAAALVASVLAGAATGRWAQDPSLGVAVALTVAGAAGIGYLLLGLHGLTVARWAARRTLASLGLLLPLATRALPLLLLFVTFLFINTEVWQVASRLDGGVMWASILLFAAVGVGFLLGQLPDELDGFDDDMDADRLAAACQGTPLADVVPELGLTDDQIHVHAEIGGLERVNLILVLLVAQAVQVMLLSVAVWVFFLPFGVLAIDPEVVSSWTMREPTMLGLGVSQELVRVATFLAAFSGLYFTVYAVNDGTYRRQFFSSIIGELDRAASVRLVYRALA